MADTPYTANILKARGHFVPITLGSALIIALVNNLVSPQLSEP
jgi:hypothetical protein